MKYLIPILTSLVLLTSCNHDTIVSVKSNPEIDSLIKITNEREETVNDFIASFNEIERNLDSVAVKQQIINLNSQKKGGEFKQSQKNRILEEIKAINMLMAENSKKIGNLKHKLTKANNKNKGLDETIVTLNNQLLQKNEELSLLNERLSALDTEVAQLKTTVDVLTEQNLTKSGTINDNTIALHTAYYVIGKRKELQEAKLIDRKGGLLGIGRTTELSANFDTDKFTRIDYTTTASIPINSDGVKLITIHPTDSYTLDMDTKDKDLVKNIIITNPEKFWSASKYLVIVKG